MRPTRHQDRHQTGRVLRRTHKQERRDETSEKKYKNKSIKIVLETLASGQDVHTKSCAKCIMRRLYHVRIQRGAGGPDLPPAPLKHHKSIGSLSNFGPDHLKMYDATEPAFNVGPPSARQRNTV